MRHVTERWELGRETRFRDVRLETRYIDVSHYTEVGHETLPSLITTEVMNAKIRI